jgi:hypothetical protein
VNVINEAGVLLPSVRVHHTHKRRLDHGLRQNRGLTASDNSELGKNYNPGTPYFLPLSSSIKLNTINPILLHSPPRFHISSTLQFHHYQTTIAALSYPSRMHAVKAHRSSHNLTAAIREFPLPLRSSFTLC